MTQMEWENVASLVSLGSGFVAAGLLLTPIVPAKLVATCERFFTALTTFPKLCGSCLFLASLLMCGILTLHRGLPQPLLHDEFSYLLAADTFSHARITNPTPRFWEHFETPQQLMVPSYMSKYPPAQAISLALGQALTGKPIIGAWLATAFATVAIYWMFLGFVSPPWALIGGVIALFHPKLLDWSQSYWGGSVAVIGSALLTGAWGRLLQNMSFNAAVILALGLIILANSRPFEGLVLSIPPMVSLLYHQRKKIGPLVLSLGLPLVFAALLMGYYNFRVTGHALRMPFVEYSRQYDIYPKFWLLSPRADAINYRNPAMEFVHRYFERSGYQGFRTMRGAQENSAYRLNLLISTTLSLAILLLPFFVGIFAIERPSSRILKITAGLFVIVLWTEIFVYPHYIAPLVPVILLIVMMGLKKLSGWHWRHAAVGKPLAWAVVIGTLIGSGVANSQPMFFDRDLLSQHAMLDHFPVLQQGRHLVFVAYGPMHSYHSELVHNLSNIDQQRIIWARQMDDVSDRQLMASHPDRTAWLLYIGGKETLTPFKP